MSVRVKVHLNPEFGVEHVKDHLVSVGANDVKVELALKYTPEYCKITFEYKGQERCLNFHYRLGIFNSNLLTLNLWGSAEEIMEGIVEKFGGILIPNECEEGNATVYGSANYNTQDALFVHKWAIAHGHVTGSKLEDIIEAHKSFAKAYLTKT